MGRVRADAQRDRRTHREQRERRDTYIMFREEQARLLAREQSLTKRLRHSTEVYLGQVDGDYLRTCPSCRELSYPYERPTVVGGNQYAAAGECAFCRSGDVKRWEPSTGPSVGGR